MGYEGDVPIYRLMQNSAFQPEDVERLSAAFEQALKELQLVDRSDPLAEIVAQSVIEVAQTGEREPRRICELAIKRIRNSGQRSN